MKCWKESDVVDAVSEFIENAFMVNMEVSR